MSDDKCACGHWMMDHSEVGCEVCMCDDFRWPTDPEADPATQPTIAGPGGDMSSGTTRGKHERPQ
jgi:hypothetical protein